MILHIHIMDLDNEVTTDWRDETSKEWHRAVAHQADGTRDYRVTITTQEPLR